MTVDEPPSGAVWLLRHVARHNEDLEGDLLEEYRRGRSDDWYWRQVLLAVAATRSTQLLLFVAFAMVYFVGQRVSLPGANPPAIALSAAWTRGIAFRVFDLTTGGNFALATIFALGIYPFVIASVIVQALATVVRFVTKRKVGHLVLATWVLAVAVGAARAHALAVFLERQSRFPGVAPLVYTPGPMFEISAVVVMTVGLAVLMGLCDYISSRGLGNGMLIAFLAALAAGAVRSPLSTVAPPSLRGLPDSAVLYLLLLGLIIAVTGTAHGRVLRHAPTG